MWLLPLHLKWSQQVFFYNCSEFVQELHKVTCGMTSTHQMTLPEETESTELVLARHLMLWWEPQPSTRMKEPAASVRSHKDGWRQKSPQITFALTFESKGFFGNTEALTLASLYNFNLNLIFNHRNKQWHIVLHVVCQEHTPVPQKYFCFPNHSSVLEMKERNPMFLTTLKSQSWKKIVIIKLYTDILLYFQYHYYRKRGTTIPLGQNLVNTLSCCHLFLCP